MSNLTYALVIMLSLNAILILGQASVLGINEDASLIYHCNGTMLGELSTGCDDGTYILSDGESTTQLPSASSSVNAETGVSYTDSITTSRSWLLESTGLGYVVNLLSAPYNIIKSLGLPEIFAFAIGGLWYGVTLFLLVAFILGRND